MIDDVDRRGVRIAVGNGSAYDLYLTRTIKHAEIVRAPTGNEAIAMFERDKLEVAAGVKSPLLRYAQSRPDLRVMDGRFMVIEQAMGMPEGPRGERVRYLRAMIEELKASGFVADGARAKRPARRAGGAGVGLSASRCRRRTARCATRPSSMRCSSRQLVRRLVPPDLAALALLLRQVGLLLDELADELRVLGHVVARGKHGHGGSRVRLRANLAGQAAQERPRLEPGRLRGRSHAL